MQMHLLRRIFPNFTFPALAKLISIIPSPLLDIIFDYQQNLVIKEEKNSEYFSEMPTLTVEEMYRRAISLFDDVDLKDLLKSQIIKQMVPFKSNKNLALNNELSAFQELINVQFDDWLPDDILNKTDKITMDNLLRQECLF